MLNSPVERRSTPSMHVLNERPDISSYRKYLPYAVLSAILFLTFFAWRHWIGINTEKEQQVFKETVYDIRHLLTDALNSYETAAKGLAGLFIASEKVTEEEFRMFSQFWGVPDRFPGMQFFSFARIVDSPESGTRLPPETSAATQDNSVRPDGNLGIRAPIIFIEPSVIFIADRLARDIFEDPVWQAAAERARDTGQTMMSNLLKLPSASGGNDVPSILLFHPTYTDSMDLESVEARQKSLQGYIITGILLDELIEKHIPLSKKEKIQLTIYDVTDAPALYPLYFDPLSPNFRPPLYFSRENISLYGRQLILDIGSTPYFEAAMDHYTSRGILAAGLIIGLLAFLFVRSQESTRERAIHIANEMTTALQENERKFRLLAENTLDLIWQMDENFRFTYVNPASEPITGYTPDELIGTQLSDHYSPGEITRIEAEAAQITAREKNWDGIMFETTLKHKDGRIIPVEVHSQKRGDDQGQILGYQGTTRDISDRKRAETEKAKLEAQFLHAQKMESIGRLAGGVAHDFNNMLAIIQGYTEMLLMETDASRPLYQKLQEIHNAAKRSSNLTQQLLAFARKQTVAPRVLNLNDTVKNTLSMMERLIGENIHLSWIPGLNLWPVQVDPVQIDQVLANLCVNARDAISDRGNVYIETTNVFFDETLCKGHPDGCIPGEYVVLEVRDDGCGMDKAVLDKLFEPFFTTKVLGKGTGLGLATVYGIVKQNNGFIEVTSSPLKGTTFTICLPRYSGDPERIQTEEAQKQFTQAFETVLLVEDEASILKMIQRMLEKKSYTVLTSQSPEEAIRLAREYSGVIHLLITDVVMPEMNGQVLAKELLTIYPDIRCLFMSGYTADIIAKDDMVEESMPFIQKPFSIEEINARVREVLNSVAPASG